MEGYGHLHVSEATLMQGSLQVVGGNMQKFYAHGVPHDLGGLLKATESLSHSELCVCRFWLA